MNLIIYQIMYNSYSNGKGSGSITHNPSPVTHNPIQVKLWERLTPEQQEAWLLARAEKNGFSLVKDEYRVVQSDWVSFRKCADSGRQVQFRRVTFEGLLTVTDEALFRETVKNGIGREKAYGCGMLTVTRTLS